MASETLSEALLAVENLLEAVTIPQPELEPLVATHFLYTLAGREINGMLVTRHCKKHWNVNPGSLARLLAMRRKLSSDQARALGGRLDTLIKYTALEIQDTIDAATLGRPPKSPRSWHVPVFSCDYRTDSATAAFQHTLWSGVYSLLPILIEWDADGKTFSVCSGQETSYRTAEGQRPPLVTMSTSQYDLKLHVALRPPEPQVYRESFRFVVASEEHRQILVGHLIKMGAQKHEVLGGQ
ncbi:MAG: hypothetical protein Q9207_003620 [Kuettlingeria erythrocarpa]